jgi:thiamine-phosphate diphosphorylase
MTGRRYSSDGADGVSKRVQMLRRGRGLYLILSEPRVPHASLAAAACERGVPVIQLREKDVDDETLLELAREISVVTAGTGTLFIVNDRPAVALRSGADGVHLGTGDAACEEARKILGREAIIGLSTLTPAESRAAVAAGADYIGVGPVFPTATKPDARNPIGVGGLAAAADAALGVPKVAIGGIAPHNACEAMAAGADYVAVISAICHADDPVGALDDFLDALEHCDRTRTAADGLNETRKGA